MKDLVWNLITAATIVGYIGFVVGLVVHAYLRLGGLL